MAGFQVWFANPILAAMYLSIDASSELNSFVTHHSCHFLIQRSLSIRMLCTTRHSDDDDDEEDILHHEIASLCQRKSNNR